MADRIHIKAVRTGKQNDANTPPTLFSSQSQSQSQSKEKNDDLIVSLSDAYENRRARQVGEWERLYTYNVYRAV